jgi:hypothetical protein
MSHCTRGEFVHVQLRATDGVSTLTRRQSLDTVRYRAGRSVPKVAEARCAASGRGEETDSERRTEASSFTPLWLTASSSPRNTLRTAKQESSRWEVNASAESAQVSLPGVYSQFQASAVPWRRISPGLACGRLAEAGAGPGVEK